MTWSGKLDAGVRRDQAKLAAAYTNQLRMNAQARRAVKGGAPPADKPVQLPFTMQLKRPRKERLEIEFAGQTAVQVYDGKTGWKLRPFLGRRDVEPYTEDELRQAAQQGDLDGWLIDYSSKHNQLALVGTEKVDGRDTYKIKVTLPDGQVRHVWVDTKSYLEVMVDGARKLDGKMHPVWTHYRDYKKVDGLMVPHVLETSVDGVAQTEKIVIDRVVINPPLDDARFARLDASDAAPKVMLASAGGGGTADAADAHAQHHDAGGKLARATRSTAEYKVPPVTLVRDDGKSVSLPAELDDGRVVVLDFIFTNCATICPVMSHVFAQLQDKLGADREKVHMVSVSIDPEEDTAKRLAEYEKQMHATPVWRMYTGTTKASVAVQQAFDAYRGDKMNHTPLTLLRAAPGKPWVRIDGFATADELAAEVHELTRAR